MTYVRGISGFFEIMNDNKIKQFVDLVLPALSVVCCSLSISICCTLATEIVQVIHIFDC